MCETRGVVGVTGAKQYGSKGHRGMPQHTLLVELFMEGNPYNTPPLSGSPPLFQ